MSPMEFQPVTLKPTVSEVQELYSIHGWLSMIVEPYKQLVVKHPFTQVQQLKQNQESPHQEIRTETKPCWDFYSSLNLVIEILCQFT